MNEKKQFIFSVGLLGVLWCLLPTSARAQDLVTGSGTWGAATATTTETAVNETFSFSFTISNPVTDATAAGPANAGFGTKEFSGFQYYLNGAPIEPTATEIVFYTSGNAGLFDLDFSDGNIVSLYDGQAFAGTPPPDMTIVPGVYPATAALDDGEATDQPGTVVTITPVPEPSGTLLLGLGLIGVIGSGRRCQGLCKVLGTSCR